MGSSKNEQQQQKGGAADNKGVVVSEKTKKKPAIITKIEQQAEAPVEQLFSSTVDDKSALRSSISDLYELGANLRNDYRYIAPFITTTSLKKQKIDEKRKISTASLATRASPGSETISTDQIWGQLSLLGAPILHEIGANISRLAATYQTVVDSSSKKSKKGKKTGVSFEDEENGLLDDDDLDILAEEDEEEEDEEFEEDDGEDDEDDGEDGEDLSEGDLLDEDPELARIMTSRSSKKKAKKSANDSLEARRQKALLDFAAGADDDEANDEDDWAAEFETRKDRDGGDNDDDDGKEDDNRGPALSKRAEKLKKKYGESKKDDDDDDELGDFGDDDGEGLGGLYGEGDDDDEGEEDEEDADIMAEMYGEDYEGEDPKFLGEDEEDDDVHGTSDAEGDEEGAGGDNDLYDADEDARFQKGMFPTDNDDGFDNILDDREGYFGGGAGEGGASRDDDDDDEDEDGLTDFQLRQKQEKKFIKTLEEKRAFNADWSMAGEVEGRARPKDSLVDEELDFEHGMKSVPVITEALTAKLEERIKQRILDNNYNDVIRRQAATTAADLTSNGVAKRDTTTDAEKSKASLMDLYEKDYLAKLQKMEDAAGLNENVAEPLTEIEKDELKAIQMWKRLAQHLDALSNYYFTPKPIQEDLNVRIRAVEKAAPAITMESVGAFAVSKASAIAPQDVFRPSQKSMLGNVSLEEMTPRERQALRRAKKDASAVTKARIEKKVSEKAEKKKRRVEASAQ